MQCEVEEDDDDMDDMFTLCYSFFLQIFYKRTWCCCKSFR